MLRFVLPSVFVCAVALAFSGTAQADVVVVQPQDSNSTVVKTKPPAVVIVNQRPSSQPQIVQAPPPKKRERKLGLHFDVGGTFGPQVTMGGFTGALRFRPKDYLGIDLGAGYYAGNDYQGFYRREIPVTANFLFFLNPQHKFQFYFLLGPGATFGRVDLIGETRSMTHIGGQGGFGVELRLAPAFALNVDARGVIRHRVDSDPRPEFVDGGRSTNTSGGALLTFGGTFYF